MPWTREAVEQRLLEIKAKGFIPIPAGMHRNDDGIVGQILEREFDVVENNLPIRDLGNFELKGIRSKSSNLTLSHKKAEIGLTPIEIFHRFGYIRHSNRNPEILKKKLFVTVKGTIENRQTLRLRGIGDAALDMVSGDEMICEWDLSAKIDKMDKVVLGIADTIGSTNSLDEQFHYIKAFLLDGLRPIRDLVDRDIIVIDFCIDQPLLADGTPNGPIHDRGPHVRVPVRKLLHAYERVTQIL